ncbi:MAG TPA: hypothetical protein VMI93_07565 [Candidatus Solibacter sp.]|nr:hypothetical protein [Candidatus Solibacter sp.]
MQRSHGGVMGVISPPSIFRKYVMRDEGGVFPMPPEQLLLKSAAWDVILTGVSARVDA